MKSIALERLFSGYSFLTAAKRVTSSKGFDSKTGMKTNTRNAWSNYLVAPPLLSRL
jgi:hypothetical protein